MPIFTHCLTPEAALARLGIRRVWYDLFIYLQSLHQQERPFPTAETTLPGYATVRLIPTVVDFADYAQPIQFENHHKMVDVHFCLTGEEVILYQPTHSLIPANGYNTTSDVQMFGRGNKKDIVLCMSPGMCAILLPGDGHQPLQWSTKSGKIQKLVVKVPVEFLP